MESQITPQIENQLVGDSIQYRQPNLTYRIGENTVNGKISDNLEAVKQAVKCILETERYSNPIYSDDYGIELEQYKGADYGKIVAGIETTLRDALLQDDRITDVRVTNVERLDLNMFKKNDMVLCRKCAPLVKLCLALIKNGQTATIKGNDLATDLKQMALNIKGNTIGDVREYTETELSNLKYYFMTTYGMDEIDAMGTKPYQTLLDKCKCLIYLAEHANGNIKAVIDKVFSDTKIANAITLMSIHKAKGLESERVVFLEPNLTMKKTKKQKQWQFDQEQNLQYVAVTRAKKELILCSSSEIKKDKNTKE